MRILAFVLLLVVVCSAKKQNFLQTLGDKLKELFHAPRPDVECSDSILDSLTDAIPSATKEVQKRLERLQRILDDSDVKVQHGSSEEFHQNLNLATEYAQKMSVDGFFRNEVANQLILSHNLTREQALCLVGIDVGKTELNKTCITVPKCPKDDFYRTFDGSCNNKKNPIWGMSFTTFLRLLPAMYEDGLREPRKAVGGGNLTSPRLISTIVLTELHVPDKKHTLALMHYGQFVDHDLTLTPVFKGINNTGIKCCHPKFQEDPDLKHPECFEIPIPKDDAYYSQFNVTCMEFVRSLVAPRDTCTFGPRQQMNQLTHFHDASMIYGSTEADAKALRAPEDGLMRTSDCNGEEYLPFSKGDMTCTRPDVSFSAGDSRNTEVPQLTTYQTAFLREHNRVARKLKEINSDWSGEKLYQEARRIVGAELQFITYNEYLPIVLGDDIMKKFDLKLRKKGKYDKKYDPKINPTILNIFAAAAYRFGHSLVTNTEEHRDAAFKVTKELQLKDVFGSAATVLSNPHNDQVRGLCTQAAEVRDQWMSRQVTNHLFQFAALFGSDLASFNIQRGRDHGLHSYNDYRELCGLKRAKTFDDFDQFQLPGVAQNLSTVYGDPDDVDIWVGGVTEKPLDGAIVGPTFACIIAEQFRRLKHGDRYWHEIKDQKHSFCPEQLKEIRKVTLARIFCDNSVGLEKIQPKVLETPNENGNDWANCTDTKKIPKMDLEQWKE